MTIYLGPPGNLQALPYMGRGIGAPLDLGASVHRSLGGVRTVDYVGDPKRTYTLERKFLTQDELSVLEGLALGAYGDPSSLVLLDPFRRNMLTENQSTAGDYSHDTTGFYSLGSSVVTRQTPTPAPPRGVSVIRYAIPAGAAIGSTGLRIADQTSAATIIATGIPAVPGLPYTLSVQQRLSSGTAVAQVWGVIAYDKAGASLSAVSSSAPFTSTGSYAQITASGTAPANTAYLAPRVLNNALSVVGEYDIDDIMLTQGTSTVWAMGTGVPRVAFVGSLDLSYPTIVGDNDLSITLQEVA